MQRYIPIYPAQSRLSRRTFDSLGFLISAPAVGLLHQGTGAGKMRIWILGTSFPQGKPAATVSTLINYNYKVHAGSFCVSVIHQNLTWMMDYSIFNQHTRSFLCVHMHNWGWAHWQQASTSFLTENPQFFSRAPDAIWTSVLWISSLTLYQLSHPIPIFQTKKDLNLKA